MNFKIFNTQVHGVERSIKASGNPMRTKISKNYEVDEKGLKRAINLGTTNIGEGHDQFLTGCIVQFDIYAPLYMWKEIQRYHFLDFISSQSTMHCLTKFNVKEQCVDETDKIILIRYQELLDDYMANPTKEQWRVLIASLPCGFVLGATMTTNYRQLKTIYNQRKNHKLAEWHAFCEWIENLPRFKELCLNENR